MVQSLILGFELLRTRPQADPVAVASLRRRLLAEIRMIGDGHSPRLAGQLRAELWGRDWAAEHRRDLLDSWLATDDEHERAEYQHAMTTARLRSEHQRDD
jgi:hypothetical protein